MKYERRNINNNNNDNNNNNNNNNNHNYNTNDNSDNDNNNNRILVAEWWKVLLVSYLLPFLFLFYVHI